MAGLRCTWPPTSARARRWSACLPRERTRACPLATVLRTLRCTRRWPGERMRGSSLRCALGGAGVSKFGVRKAGYRDLIWEAGKACFDSVPGVGPKDIEGLVVGSVMPERTAFQSHISSLAAEALGIKPSALSARTEHMCA